ncbi:MAG: urea ABC transporter ATP-binding protein [Desulfatitalea sp. BRH_c12]|nr:MAG: urea ABC transporter ATP-binding protein [Desulfatitalea sp. BRH_c12]
MLRIEKLNHYYGGSHTLWDIDLDVPQGQCTCLMGRNGVGKTTLINCIMGLLPLTSGRMFLERKEITKLSADRRARLGVGYVPQGRQIFPLLTVEENLILGLSTGKERLKKIPELIFELFPVLHTMIGRLGGDLSGGQQQQLAIGRALVLQPSLLILDEPTEGIQPNIVKEIGAIIDRLRIQLGMTVLLVEQKLNFTRNVADRFAILDRGQIVAAENIEKLDNNLIRNYLTV